MLDKVCSLEKQLHNSARILEELAQQIPQARFQLQTASRLETEYRNSFRSFVHKLQGKQEEESARKALQGKLASWKNEPDWRKRREKAFRFLAGRGFNVDVIYQILDEEPLLNYDNHITLAD